jgi:hypothetical protein
LDFRPSALLHLLVVVAAAVEARPMVAAFVVKEAHPIDVVADCVVALETDVGVVAVAAVVAAEGAAFADLAFRKDYVYPTQAAAAVDDIHAAYSAS